MKFILIYGTLSGSTMTATELVGESLRSAGNEVTCVSVDLTKKEYIASHDVLVIASPSWEDRGLDGQPLPEIRAFIESLTPSDLSGKKVALLGLGDTAYPHFCGAIDVLETLLKKIDVTPIIESLRIDKFYSLPENENKIRAWAHTLAVRIAS